MARDDGFPQVVTSHAQLLLEFISEAESIYDASDSLRQLPQAAHEGVYKTPQAPERPDVLELANNTPRFSPMRARQLCFGRTSKGTVKSSNSALRTKRAGSDVGRRVRVKWIPHYVKARNPPKSKMLWFKGRVIEHSTTANV